MSPVDLLKLLQRTCRSLLQLGIAVYHVVLRIEKESQVLLKQVQRESYIPFCLVYF